MVGGGALSGCMGQRGLLEMRGRVVWLYGSEGLLEMRVEGEGCLVVWVREIA